MILFSCFRYNLLTERTFRTHFMPMEFVPSPVLISAHILCFARAHIRARRFPLLVYRLVTIRTYLLLPMEFISLLLCLIFPVAFLYRPTVSTFYGSCTSNSYQGQENSPPEALIKLSSATMTVRCRSRFLDCRNITTSTTII
jgi:hypothetical protein